MYPFISLQQSYELFQELAPTIKLAEVNAALKARFVGEPDLIYRGAEQPKGGEAGIRAAYKKAMAAPVTAYKPDAVKAVALHRLRHAWRRGRAQADPRPQRHAGAVREWREADDQADADQQGPHQCARSHGLGQAADADERHRCVGHGLVAVVCRRAQEADADGTVAHARGQRAPRPWRGRWTTPTRSTT